MIKLSKLPIKSKTNIDKKETSGTSEYLNLIYNEIPVINTEIGYIVESPTMHGYKALVDEDMNVLYERKNSKETIVDFTVVGKFLIECKRTYPEPGVSYRHDDEINVYKLSDRIKTRLVKIPREYSTGLTYMKELKLFGKSLGYMMCYSVNDILNDIFPGARTDYISLSSGFILVDEDLNPIGKNASEWYKVVKSNLEKYGDGKYDKNENWSRTGMRVDPKANAFQERLLALLLSKVTINNDKSVIIKSITGEQMIEAVLIDDKYLVESVW